MQANYYVLTNYSPNAQADMQIRLWWKLAVEQNWDGISQWQF